MSIKVLFITHVSEMGGANHSMCQLIKELKETYSVIPVVLCPPKKSNINLQDNLKEIGVEYLEFPIRFFKTKKPTLYLFFSYLKYLYRQRHFYKRLESYNFDIIHSNSSVIDIGGYLSKQLKCKHIWHLREFGDLDYSLFPLGGKIYEKFGYSHADAYIAISKAVEKHFADKLSSRKIHLIYNGIKLVDSCFCSKHNSKNINFICVGLIHPSKNQIEIVNAVNSLVNTRHCNNFHVTFVGINTHPYTKLIKDLINQYQLESYFTILKEMDNIHSLLSSMDVGIMSSRSEAFGRVTIEYMLHNLLVIANDSGANKELVNDGETGIIYKSGDFEDLANKMNMIITTPSIIEELSHQALVYSNNNFLSMHNTMKVYNLYKTILKI